VAALYEAGKVLHMPNPDDKSNGLDKLEAQMVQWEPTDSKSPDRIDALVHLVTHMILKGGKSNILRAGSMPWS
jgi:phage terminase large subunit-like protein